MQLGFIPLMKNELKNAIQIALKSKSVSEISTVRVTETAWDSVVAVDLMLRDGIILNGLLKKDDGAELWNLIAPLAVVKQEEKKK